MDCTEYFNSQIVAYRDVFVAHILPLLNGADKVYFLLTCKSAIALHRENIPLSFDNINSSIVIHMQKYILIKINMQLLCITNLNTSTLALLFTNHKIGDIYEQIFAKMTHCKIPINEDFIKHFYNTIIRISKECHYLREEIDVIIFRAFKFVYHFAGESGARIFINCGCRYTPLAICNYVLRYCCADFISQMEIFDRNNYFLIDEIFNSEDNKKKIKLIVKFEHKYLIMRKILQFIREQSQQNAMFDSSSKITQAAETFACIFSIEITKNKDMQLYANFLGDYIDIFAYLTPQLKKYQKIRKCFIIAILCKYASNEINEAQAIIHLESFRCASSCKIQAIYIIIQQKLAPGNFVLQINGRIAEYLDWNKITQEDIRLSAILHLQAASLMNENQNMEQIFAQLWWRRDIFILACGFIQACGSESWHKFCDKFNPQDVHFLGSIV